MKVSLMSAGARRQGSPEFAANMTETEIEALFVYQQSLPAIEGN